MDRLPIAPRTQKAVSQYVAAPSSVLILHGPPGVGKTVLAQQILSDILEIVKDKLISYPYLINIEPVKDSISIDSVRTMQSALIRSVPGNRPIRRAVLIQDAQKMTTEAQNALLKSLEESPADSVFILCVDNLHNLLSTVVSRSQQLAVLPLTESAAVAHFGDRAEVRKAFHMSGGRASLMQALLNNVDHQMLAAVESAKDILQKPAYERLLLVNNLSKDKAEIKQLLDALMLLARISLTTSVDKDRSAEACRWHGIVKQVGAAQQAISNNAGAKLVLTDLFLHL